jgi:Txe/YoeB family toxin of Txe-Axe toxin-antitoxin module
VYRIVAPEQFLSQARKFFRRHPDLKPRFGALIEDLQRDPFQPRLNLHPLSGKLAGCHAVNLTHSYRVTLTLLLAENEITLLDMQAGRVLAELDALGLAHATLVVYSADHGDLCGGHGLFDKHFVMYDELMRVPLLMRWPNKIQPGTVVRQIAGAIDLLPTLTQEGSQMAGELGIEDILIPPIHPADFRDRIFRAPDRSAGRRCRNRKMMYRKPQMN